MNEPIKVNKNGSILEVTIDRPKANAIDKISIEAIRFIALVDKYNINQIDKLLVDVEGSEFAILNDILPLPALIFWLNVIHIPVLKGRLVT